jgi:aryl-phospho-beta-D-glucosidase BglC (GH1 family)
MFRQIILVLFSFYCCAAKSQIAPIATKGSELIDANGASFIIKGVNWWGANGSLIPYSANHSKGINTHSMPFGLHTQHLDTIVLAIKTAGFNTVRLPFSNEMLHDTVKSKVEWMGPNTHLTGLTPIEVMDSIISQLTEQGIFVLLNNHSTTAHWCCNYDMNGLWYGKNDFYSQTTADWIHDWVMLSSRYEDNPNVIGADLRNEVRPLRKKNIPLPKNPNWGRRNKKDWHKAATEAGNAILKENPNWLIVVEGINARVLFLSQLSFPHLQTVKQRPIQLDIPNKLVYEIHNYGFSWVKANLLFPKRQIRYADISTEKRFELFQKNWGFVADPGFKNCAPVLLGEFGCSSLGTDAEPWLRDLTAYVAAHNQHFCWWTLEEELGNEGSYGIMNDALNQINVFDDWRGKYLNKLLSTAINNP